MSFGKLQPQAWIYKCSADSGYSWLDGGFFKRKGIERDFGGEEWIRSPLSWNNLAALKRGDLIFCHQGHAAFRAIVGLTIAASSGYADPEGRYHDRCTTLDLGPQRVGFKTPVTLTQISAAINDRTMAAYAPGKRQSTFHAVESELRIPLIRLCISLNPSLRRAIINLTHLSRRIPKKTQSMKAAIEIIRDPIRREMTIEAYERKAAWSRNARRLYGFECMIPGCRFQLIKDDGERYIEVHHIIAMCDGGSPNDKMNLSVLCPNHHREIHFASKVRRGELTALVRREQARRLRRA